MPKVVINAHLLSKQAGYRAAGIHGYLSGTLAALHDAAPPDWDFTVLVSGDNPLHFNSLQMRRAPFSTESPLRRIAWEQTLQPFALRGYDVYHAGAFVAPLLPTPPSVVTIYDLSFLHYPQVLSTARRLYLRWLTPLTCRRARRVIAISHSTAHDLTASLGVPAEKIIVAAPGYDRATFRPLPSADVAAFKAQKNLPARFWLFLGTLEPRKNLVTLLDAYAALPTSERLPLILAGGKGWDFQAIFERISAHGLGESVQCPGYIPTSELPFWYNSAEAFVYPSVFEGFGLPVLEAMACGTPVLASDASSLPEVVGTAGICPPPLDVPAWTTALRRAASDSAWRANAREQGFSEAARYTWAETAHMTLESYRQALA